MKTLSDLLKEKKRQQSLKKKEDHIKYIEDRLYPIAIAVINLYKGKDKRNITGGNLIDTYNNMIYRFNSYVNDSDCGYSHIVCNSIDNVYKRIIEKMKGKKGQPTAKEKQISFSRNYLYDDALKEYIDFHYNGCTFCSRLKNASLHGTINQMSVNIQVFSPKNRLFYHFNYN